MKRLLILIICLLPGIIWAQSTPEAIIGEVPSLPSASALAAGGDAVDNFTRKIHELREAASRAQQPTVDAMTAAVHKDADKAKRDAEKRTGMSIEQMQNMSDADAAALAQREMAKAMSGAGVNLGNMSLADLQALEGKSDEEIAAALGAGGMSMGGLSMDEIMTMEDMSDAEAEAYLRQNGRMERIQKAAPKQTAKQKRQVKAGVAAMNATQEIQKIRAQWDNIDKLQAKEVQEVARQIGLLDKKYAADLNRAAGDVEACVGKADCDAAQKRHARLSTAFATEAYTLWRNQVSKMQGRLKTRLTDAHRMDELTGQVGAASDSNLAKINSHAYALGVADMYLDLTLSVITLPRSE